MTDFSDKLTTPFTDHGMYLAYGALGGYVGGYVWSKGQNLENVDPVGKFQLENAIAGGVTTYLYDISMTGVDTKTWWKGALVGVLGMWVWNKFLRQYVGSWNA